MTLPGGLAEHPHGSVATTARGTIPLGPKGGGADLATLSLSAIGILVSSGDTVRYTWYVTNVTDVPLMFQIFAHSVSSSSTLHLVYVNATAPSATGEWQVPGSDPYDVSFTNPNARALNVTYQFDGVPAVDAAIFFAGGGLVVIGILAYAIVTVRGIRREAKATPEAGADTAPPTESTSPSTPDESAQSPRA